MAWLLGIARNKLRDSARRGRVEVEARKRLGIPAIAFDDEDMLRVQELAIVGGEALELLEKLPAPQRDAVRARVVDELDYELLALKLGHSETGGPPARQPGTATTANTDGGEAMNDHLGQLQQALSDAVTREYGARAHYREPRQAAAGGGRSKVRSGWVRSSRRLSPFALAALVLAICATAAAAIVVLVDHSSAPLSGKRAQPAGTSLRRAPNPGLGGRSRRLVQRPALLDQHYPLALLGRRDMRAILSSGHTDLVGWRGASK